MRGTSFQPLNGDDLLGQADYLRYFGALPKLAPSLHSLRSTASMRARE